MIAGIKFWWASVEASLSSTDYVYQNAAIATFTRAAARNVPLEPEALV